MDLNEAVWKLLDGRKLTTDAQRRALHVEIMRAIETSKTQVGKKQGVTVMTPEASAAGDQINRTPGHRGNPGEPKPKTV